MPEQTAPQTGEAAPATPPATESAPAGEQQSTPPQEDVAPSRDDRSPAEVEAFWKNRQSSEAAAFAAKEQALRNEIASLSSQVKEREVKASAKDAADQTEVERLRQLNQTLNEQLEQTKQQAVAETRKAKYPDAAENLEDTVLTQMDEANLAALNARLKVNVSGGSTQGNTIDPNQAARPAAGGQKPLSEQTSEELKAQLAAQSESFVDSLKR